MGKLYVFLFFLIGLFAVAIAGSIHGAWYFTLKDRPVPLTADDWKNFSTVAGLGTTSAAAVLAALASFVNLLAQAKTSKEVERVKKVLEKRIPAYANLFAAAHAYYRHLAPLETGVFSVEAIEAAETKMKDVEGDTLFVEDEYAKAWRWFWQDARYTKEKVNRDIPDPDGRKGFWREQCKILARDLDRMKEIAQRVVQN